MAGVGKRLRRIAMLRSTIAALLVLGLALGGVEALAGADAAAKVERLVYLVKYGTAADLGEALRKHFKDDVEVEPVAGTPDQCLLIRVAPDTVKEVVQLLEKL